MFLQHRAHAGQRSGLDHAVGVEKQHERLGGEFRSQVAAGRETEILGGADHAQPWVRRKAGDQRFELLRQRGVVDEHDLTGLTQHGVEAIDQHVVRIVIDDHDRDR